MIFLLLFLLAVLVFLLLCTLYFHYGIDSWQDLVRELRILRFKLNFVCDQVIYRSQSTIP